MGAGCTKPMDNIVEVRDFGGSFMRGSGSGYDEGDGLHVIRGVVAEGRDDSQELPAGSLDQNQGQQNGCASPDASQGRNRNHRGGALRVMMHIQEAGNYGPDASTPSFQTNPPLPSSASVNASPRRNQHIVHDGAYKTPMPAGNADHLTNELNTFVMPKSSASFPAQQHSSDDAAGDDEKSVKGSTRPRLVASPTAPSAPPRGFILPVLSSHILDVPKNNAISPQHLATQDATAGQAGVKDEESLALILSREVSRKSRRSNLKHLAGFANANAAMRKESRHPPDHELALALYEKDRAMVLSGMYDGGNDDAHTAHQSQRTNNTVTPSDARYFGDGDDTARTGSTAYTRMSANTNTSSPQRPMFPQKGQPHPSGVGQGFDDNYYSSTVARTPAAASARLGNPQELYSALAGGAASAAPADRASSAPTRGRDLHGILPNTMKGNLVLHENNILTNSEHQNGDRKSSHHHHHYKCFVARQRRLERRWRREAIALHCPQLLAIAQPAGVGDLSSFTPGILLHCESVKSIQLSQRLGKQSCHNQLLDGEGYNSEVPSETSRKQWRKIRSYHDKVYSVTMNSLAQQRAAQRRRRKIQMRTEYKKMGGAVGEYRKSVRSFYNQCDSSASCSSYDEFDDQLAVAKESVGEWRLGQRRQLSGMPSYRKPLWAMDEGAGVLSAQYDLLVRSEQRRNAAERMMRVVHGNESVPAQFESEDATTTQQLDTIFPHTVPLRQYAASKAISQSLKSPISAPKAAEQFEDQGNMNDTSFESNSCDSCSSGELFQDALSEDQSRFTTETTTQSLGRSRTQQISEALSSTESSSSDSSRGGFSCDCSSCSCSEGESSCGVETESDEPPPSDATKTLSARRSSNSTSGGSASVNSHTAGSHPLSTASVYCCIPKAVRDQVDAYVTEKRRALGQTRRAVVSTVEGNGYGGGGGYTKQRRGASAWLQWLRWAVFRKGAGLSRSCLGMLSSLQRSKTSLRKRRVRRGEAVNVDGGTEISTVTSAEAYFSNFFKNRYLPLNLSSRVPFLESYQHRFFRMVSAAELHRGIIHPFAVDPPLLMSCAKDLKGEARNSPYPPTLVTIASVEAMQAGLSSLAVSAVAAKQSSLGCDMSPSRNQPTIPSIRSPNASNLINRPILSTASQGNTVIHPQLNAVGQLLQELKKAHKAALSSAKSQGATITSLPEYRHAFVQDRNTMYDDIASTLVHVKYPIGPLQQPSQSGGLAPYQNPLGGAGGLNSASLSTASSSSMANNTNASFLSGLLTEETEKHMNGILFRRYSLLLAGHNRTTVDFHRFVSLIAPAILRYKLVHTNTSFVKEARTLQETKAAERARQAEAQQQAQKALQEQQEQQRLLLQQQQQMLLMQQGQNQVHQPVYMQIQGGGIAALAVGSDNALLSPALIPGVPMNSQAVMLLVSSAANQPPQPALCYILVFPPSGIVPTSTAVVMHQQQMPQFHQQLQMQQQQQQMLILQQQQQQGGVLNPQQQQQLFHLQQQQQQLALMMSAATAQQNIMLSLSGPSKVQPTVPEPSKSTTPSPAAPMNLLPGPPPTWQVPSFLTIMEGVKLLPSILYLQTSDVLFGTTRTVRHGVSVPTRVCIVTANKRLGDSLTRAFVKPLLTLCGKQDDTHDADPKLPHELDNMPRWMGQYAFPNKFRTAQAEDSLWIGYYHSRNGHVSDDAVLPTVAVDAGGRPGTCSLVVEQQLRHMLHGHQLSAQYAQGSLIAPSCDGHHNATSGVGQIANSSTTPRLYAPSSASSSMNSSQQHGAFVPSSNSLTPPVKVLETHVVHPHSYVHAMKMGEMALRQWARRVHQYNILAASPNAGNACVDPVALARIYCEQQENILKKQLSRMARANSCEIVTLHPSLLRKKLSGEERRRRRAEMTREPLKRASAGKVPQPQQQQQGPIGVGEAAKAKPQSSSSTDKPLFSREAISVIVLQQGGSALASDPLMAAWQQRYAKSLLRTRHSVMGVGSSSMAFESVYDESSEIAGLDTSRDVPTSIIMSQHIGASTEPLMMAAARSGLLSSRAALERDAMRGASAYNTSEFMAHCIADFTIHNEHMYRYAHVKGASTAAAVAGTAGQPPAAPQLTNPEVEAQRSIAKAILTGVRLGYLRAAEIVKLSVEATNDELAFAANRQETLHKGRSTSLMPQTVSSQRYGVTAGRTVGPNRRGLQSRLQRKSGAGSKAMRGMSAPHPSASSLQLEARLALMQQQCRYIADRALYQFGCLHRHSFTDYPSLMLSLLMREGLLTVSVLNSALVANGGLPIAVPAPLTNSPQGQSAAVSTPRSQLQQAQATAAAISNSTKEASVTTFTVPAPLLDSLLPSFYHHPLTSPVPVSDSCVLQNVLAFDLQNLFGVSLAMPAGSPPPIAAPQQFAPLGIIGSPTSQQSGSGPKLTNVNAPPHQGPLNDTSLLRAKFNNHALLTKAMSTIIGPSSPTSSSTIYVRDNKLFCATVGHHTASVLFNISPLAQHVVQNALNIRQQFAKTLATQLQMIQHISSSAASAQILMSSTSSANGEESDHGSDTQSQKTRNAAPPTVINLQPLQAQLRALLFKATTLTNLVLGDDIRYRYQAAKATSAAAYNNNLNAMLSNAMAPTTATPLTASALHAMNANQSAANARGVPVPPLTTSPMGGNTAGSIQSMAPGIPPSSLVDINTYKTQQSVVPAGCCGQLFVPLVSLPDLSLNGRQQRVRSHNKSRHRRSGSASSMASSTGSLSSSLHSSASRQDSSQSDRKGIIGENPTIASSASSASSNGSALGRHDKSSGHSVSLSIPSRSAMRAVNDLVSSSRQAASWLGVQLAASTFANFQTHDCISPNLKLPLTTTVPVGPTVCVATVEISSVFSQAPVPCAPSLPSFLNSNPPPPTAMMLGGLPALRGVPAQGQSPLAAEGSDAISSHANSPTKSAPAPPILTAASGPNTVFHRLPYFPDPTTGTAASTGNPTLSDPLFANALATVSSVGNLAYTVQTTVHSKSSLSPNYTVLTASTDTWNAIVPEEMSMFLSMLCPPDWANHGASTNSFLSVMAAAKVDFGSADVRGPFVHDRRRSYMSHHTGSGQTSTATGPLPTPWVPCALGSTGVVASQSFLSANGISIVADLEGDRSCTPPTPPMVPTLPHPSTVTPSSTHYTSFFLSQTYCDVFGPCDYVRAYLSASSVGLRGILEALGGGGAKSAIQQTGGNAKYALSASQLLNIATNQQVQQQMGTPPLPSAQAPPPNMANPSGNTPTSSNFNIAAPDACTIIFEVISLLESFSAMTLRHLASPSNNRGSDWISAFDRLRIHHLLYSVKIILVYGDYYHACADGEPAAPDGSARTENSWYWEELGEFEAWLSRMMSNVAVGKNGQAERPCHVSIELPSIPPPPPVHVRLYRRFREKQADLMYHQILKPKLDEHRKAHYAKYEGGAAINNATAAPANGPSSTTHPKSTTDPMFKTSPSTHGGDDFRNAASILSEVVAEEAAALDRMLLHYRLVKDLLRQRRAARLQLLSSENTLPSVHTAISNHLAACEQPFESVEFLVRAAAPTEGGATPPPQQPFVYHGAAKSGINASGNAQLPITVTSPATSSNVSSQQLTSLGSNLTSNNMLAATAEVLTAAHYPSVVGGDEGGGISASLATSATACGLTYAQPRHYVVQILAFK